MKKLRKHFCKKTGKPSDFFLWQKSFKRQLTLFITMQGAASLLIINTTQKNIVPSTSINTCQAEHVSK